MSLTVRTLHTLSETGRAAQVLDEVWSGDPDRLSASLLRALAHTGNYVAGVYDGDALVGASVAFFEAPGERALHSHITGILPAFQGGGAGRLVKQHQRFWALERGIEAITWTFDPLLSRNACFNLGVLGARVREYLVDFYGAMDDGVNRGDFSDRLSVAWDLRTTAGPAVVGEGVTSEVGIRRVRRSGEVRDAVVPDSEVPIVAVVGIPDDIDALRRSDPDAARGHRLRVREEFTGHLAAGLQVVGFERHRGYLFAR